jgi:putative FmdB family regulatory protein
MPLYNYRCEECAAHFEVLVRASRGEPTACQSCGAEAIRRVPTSFAVAHNELDSLRALDPKYKRLVEDEMAKTPDAEPMRHLSQLTPFSAADDPGEPIDF